MKSALMLYVRGPQSFIDPDTDAPFAGNPNLSSRKLPSDFGSDRYDGIILFFDSHDRRDGSRFAVFVGGSPRQISLSQLHTDLNRPI